MFFAAVLALASPSPFVSSPPVPRSAGRHSNVLVAGRYGEKLQAKVVKGVLVAYVVEHGRVLRSAKRFFQGIGAQIAYDQRANMLTINEVGRQIGISPRAQTMSVDGEQTPLSYPAMARKGEVTIPLRAVVEALGAHVQIHSAGQSATSTVLVVDENDTPVVAGFSTTPDTVAVNTAAPIALDSHPLVEDKAPDRDRLRTRVSVDANVLSWINANGRTETNANVVEPCGAEVMSTFTVKERPMLVDASESICRYRLTPAAIQMNVAQAQLGLRLGDSDFYPSVAFQSITQRSLSDNQAWGFGFNKLPTPEKTTSFEGNVMYFPLVNNATCKALGCGSYQEIAYGAGVVEALGTGFLHAGYRANYALTDTALNKGLTHGGLYFGLGFTLQ